MNYYNTIHAIKFEGVLTKKTLIKQLTLLYGSAKIVERRD